MDCAVYTDAGGRRNNEDAVRCVRGAGDQLLAVVCDGLGGHDGGETASATAVDAVCAGWSGKTDAEELVALVRQANLDVLALQKPAFDCKTTAVVLAVGPGHAAWAHAGDTRLYRFDGGELAFQTHDHSVAQMSVLLGDITPEQIRFCEDRSRVLRALGQDEDLAVEVGECALEPGRHAFLLCTDGFWEYVLEDEMAEDLGHATSAADWLERMRGRLAARVAQMAPDPAHPDNDNNTAAAVWLDV